MSEPSPLHRVLIEPSGIAFEVGEQDPILMAALAAGWRLPSSCRNGTCRSCICRLRTGEISYVIEWPGLSAEEKAEGWILPCVAIARTELVLEQPGTVSVFG